MLSRSIAVNALGLTLAVIAAATIIGLVTLWPDGDPLRSSPAARQPDTHQAEVVSVERARCTVPGTSDCRRIEIELLNGPDDGERARLDVAERRLEAEIDVGDRLRVFRNPAAEAPGAAEAGIAPYSLLDFERRSPLLLLVIVFAVLVVVTGRLRGVRALLGLAASLAVIVLFVIPAILHGESPAGVALVGALAIMFATIPLAHGVGVKTVAACLGTSISLLLALGLAELFIELANLSGLTSEEAVFLRATVGDISLQGLLLAGMIIGALGVLDDLTVTQASTVLALRRANANLDFGRLFREAHVVGQDHITATVNTLVLAYAGASLPILLIFSVAGTSFLDAVNTEAVAGEVVGMLVGSIGLIAAVPITTALAALLATQVSRKRLELETHEHAH